MEATRFKPSKFDWIFNPIGTYTQIVVAPSLSDLRKQREEKQREIMRHFKIEITSSFWSTKTKYIQREVPLSDEELEKLFLKK